MRLLRLTLLILGVGFCGQASVKDNLKKGIHVDLGAIGTRIQERGDVPTEYRHLVGSMSGLLRLRGSFPIGRKWVWEPSLGVALPWKSGPDGATHKFTNHIDLTFSYPVFPWLRTRIGPGIQWLLSFSDGGEVVLNNGTSTSSFYTPGYISQSFILTVQAGFGIIMTSKLSLNLELYSSGILDRLRRNFDLAVTLGWRL